MIKYFAILMAAFFISAPALAADAQESAYDRVMRTQTIRCGYLPYEPFLSKDANTGKISGITYDYVNEIAKKNGITVEWAEEVNIDQIVPALNGGRIDAFCVPCTPEKNWVKNIDFAGAMGAQPYFVYVPKDSAITEQQLPTAKFAIVDGYALSEITKKFFPEAELLSLTQTTSAAEMYDQLRYKKVDAHVNESISAVKYMKQNPDVIRPLSAEPIIAMKMYLVTPKGDQAMNKLFDEKFSSDLPENEAFMKGLLVKYGLAENSMLLGEACGETIEEDGTKTCGAIKKR